MWEEHSDNHLSFLHFFQMMSSEHLTGGWLLQLLVVLLSLCLASAGPLQPLNGTECTAKGPASYILVFTGHWSPQAFPKQYPLFRPPAQWSKLIGEKLCKGENKLVHLKIMEWAVWKMLPLVANISKECGVGSSAGCVHLLGKMRWKHTHQVWLYCYTSLNGV